MPVTKIRGQPKKKLLCISIIKNKQIIAQDILSYFDPVSLGGKFS